MQPISEGKEGTKAAPGVEDVWKLSEGRGASGVRAPGHGETGLPDLVTGCHGLGHLGSVLGPGPAWAGVGGVGPLSLSPPPQLPLCSEVPAVVRMPSGWP